MLIRSNRCERRNFHLGRTGHCGVMALWLCKNAIRYRLSKAKLDAFYCDVAKTILFWFICVYALTMTGFGGIFVTFSASSSFYSFEWTLKNFIHMITIKCTCTWARCIFSSPEHMLRMSFCDRSPSVVQRPSVRPASVRRLFTFSNDISSETTGLFPSKLCLKHQCTGGTNNC